MREDDESASDFSFARGGRGALTSTERVVAQTQFLRAFRATGNVAAACRDVGLARKTVYSWRKDEPDFAAAWAEAEEDAVDVLRAAAVRRGVHGWDVPVVSMGKMVLDQTGKPLMERKYSDPLLLALLKARAPEHRDQRHLELTGANGAAIDINQRVVFVLPQVDDTPPRLPFVDAAPGTGSLLPERTLILDHNLCNDEVEGDVEGSLEDTGE